MLSRLSLFRARSLGGQARAWRWLLLLVLLASLLLPTTLRAQDARFFPQTGYRVEDDLIWEYFQARGGVDTFGYPVSNTFRFRGLPVQLFQRHIVQVVGDTARPVNLLDPDLMPLTLLNGSTFPAYDSAVAMAAPAPDAPDYGEAVARFLDARVPNTWQSEPVGFRDYFLSAAPDAPPGLDTLVALEVWGFPTSAPMRDPSNDNFVYQRFQRGIMHFDASTGVTRGILLGDAFKSLLSGENLPADQENDLAASPFLRLYAPDQPNGLARTDETVQPPITLQNTDLSDAFTPMENQGSTPPPSRVALQSVATGLASPIFLTQSPGDNRRLFVVDQIGVIRVIRDGQLLAEPFLDLRARMVSLNPSYDERGLLGLAFHPDYAQNGRFFVYYSAPLAALAPSGWDHTSHLSEFRVSSASADRADAASEQVLLAVNQPQGNHNGGTLAFGPEGYLYLSLGDGGGANDTGLGHPSPGNGQNRESLLGSILRLDMNGARPYAVPSDNPFAGQQAGLAEVWAYGFRNPYRFSFDRQSGALYAADAGQNLWEEVSRVERGGNYGWNRREATHCFNPAAPSNPPATCATLGPWGEPLLAPVIEYPHSGSGPHGLAVVGGYVYRGSAIPGLQGQYLFGDWSRSFSQPQGQLFASTPQTSGLWPVRVLSVEGSEPLTHFVLGFGEDNSGELYLLASRSTGPSGTSGQVFRIVAAP